LSQILKPKKGYKKIILNPRYLELEIPDDWEIATLGSFTKSHNSGVFKNKEFYGSGVNIVGVSDLYQHDDVDGQIFSLVRLTDEEKKNHDLKSGDLVYGESSLVRTGIGKTIFVTKQGEGTYFAWHTRRLRINNKVLPKFISYLLDLHIFRNSIVSRSTTTALTGITTGDYFATILPFPPSKLEQQKIISILINMDEVITNTKKIINQTNLLKQGLIQKLLTKGIDHKKFKKVSNFFKKEIEIPEHWDYPKFNDIIKTNPFTKIEHQTVPYIPMDAVDRENPHFNYFEEREFSKNSSLSKFQENDVLFARITPSTENGKTSIVENFERKGIVSSELTVLRPSPKIIPRYLYYYVKSYRIRQFAISQMLGTTGRQRVPDYVFKEDLNIELPPIPEQQKIISIISKVDEQIITQRKHHKKLESLKKSLMLKLLTGDTRVV
jgi:type I restriction enzyme, S subunit